MSVLNKQTGMTMTPEQRHQADTTTGSMERHELMYRISANNPDKGVAGGDCNVTQCQKAGASSYNTPMKAFYCQECAYAINRGNFDKFVDEQPDFSLAYGDDPRDRETNLPTERLNPKTGGSVYDDEKGLKRQYTQAILKKVKAKGEEFMDNDGWYKPVTLVRTGDKTGRNDPCPCQSGLKYKKCCLSL